MAPTVKTEHPPFKQIIYDVVKTEAPRIGVSRAGIKNYAVDTYKLKDDERLVTNISQAIKKGVESGIFALPKGASGKVKTTAKATKEFAPKPKAAPKKAAKKAAITKADKAKKATKPTAKKAAPKKAAPKKAAPKKAATKKAAPKKAAPKKAAPKKAAPKKAAPKKAAKK